MPEKCPSCDAPEVEASTPRTTYACGSSDLDQRPETFMQKCSRYCMHCLRSGGRGDRELRPYGPDGRDVCAECTFNGPPVRLKEAERQLGARMLTSEPLLLDTNEQIGPRPLKSKSQA
jgi:hypothetical protein